MKTVRLDKWLWAVRIYKTRSLASDACRKGRIMVNGLPAKPSKEIHGGELILVRKPPVIYNYLVKELTENRVSAKIVVDFIEDKTSIEELNKLKVKDIFSLKRDKGQGRPTKKERREIDKLKES